MSDVTVSIRVDDDLYERAKVRAQGQGHTVESILTKLLTDWVGPPPVQPPVPPPVPEPEPEPAYQTYTVKAGDTLSKIAKEFYGDATKYPIIAEYNSLEDPGRIFIGQVLRIPPLTPPTPEPPPPPVEPPTLEDLNIPWVPSPHFNERPDPDHITTIVVHATANSTLTGVLSWFRNPTAYLSAHYVIGKDGRIVQMVKDEDRAWHAGRSEWREVPNVNDYGLGIELVNLNDGQDPYPEAQYQSLVKLCQALVHKYNVSTEDIVGHYQVSPGRKTDPRGLDLNKLRQEIAAG
ncbi:MAG: LysM peptidoglycan-binding domain-containing protein [Anaerolineales bacterium]|nr:MAG: LysM peptidoglycan-binding domain-containing protein [Anaerolineales bacterium]